MKYTAPYIFVLVSVCYFQFFISVLELIFLLIAYLTSVQTCFLPTLCLQANIFQCSFFPPSRKMNNSLSLILRKTVLLNCNVTAPFFFQMDVCAIMNADDELLKDMGLLKAGDNQRKKNIIKARKEDFLKPF